MNNNPFTIQTYFPTGDTRSYRISQVPTRTIQSIYIPREELEKAIKDRDELQYNGLYFLFDKEGYLQSNEETTVYIGESENVASRLKNHAVRKENWEIAVVFTTNSAANQLTKADIKYLENHSYQKVLEAKRYALKQNVPTKSFVNEAREADLMDLFKTISTLLSFVGFPIFTPVATLGDDGAQDDCFYIRYRGTDVRAMYSKDGMNVLKDSKIAEEATNSFTRQKLIDKLIQDGFLNEIGIFIRDYNFSSPSTASSVVMKTANNGWITWKNKDGKTLDEIVGRNN